MNLSTRLEHCLQYTKGFKKLADIGTDHAMLPIAAVTRKYVEKAIAIDNKFGPFLQARTNVKKYHLTDDIEVLLGDGIAKIGEDTDIIVISGMGGELIVHILGSNPLKHCKRLVLQPNRNVPAVRDFLVNIGFKITDEAIIEDHHKLYEIIIAEPGHEALQSSQIEFGPINLMKRPYLFIKKVRQEYQHMVEILPNITDALEQKRITERIHLLEEVLYERK